MILRLALVTAMGLALSACGETEDTPATTQEGAGAQGEILGGSISDEMVPMEQTRSSSPAANEESGASGDTAPGGADDDPQEPAEEG